MSNVPIPPLSGALSVHSFLKFVAIGGFSTGVQYLIAAVLHLAFGVSVVVASSVGFLVSTVLNYFLNKRLTFGADSSHKSSAPKFALAAATGLTLNTLSMFLFLRAGVPAVGAQLITTMGVLVWNYTINGLWTFRKPPP